MLQQRTASQEGGAEAAREQLQSFWHRVSLDGALSPAQQHLFNRILGYWCSDGSPAHLWLDTWATNERAIRCYQALGFVQEARLRRHVFVDGEYVDELVMGLLRDEWRAEQRGGPYAQG